MEQEPKKHWSHQKLRKFATLTQEEYIDERLNSFREWYDRKATDAKKSYQLMRATTVLGGAVVPVLINIEFEYMNYITTAISLMVVALVSLESVFHYREQWINYRATEQLLAKEYFNFVAGEGHYRGMKESNAFLDFVERVENAIASENASTLNVMTTMSDKKAEGTTVSESNYRSDPGNSG